MDTTEGALKPADGPWFDGANIGTRLILCANSMLSAILFEREILHRQPKLGQDLFVRNPAAASLCEPGVGAGESLLLFGGERLVIDGRGGDGPRDVV